MSASFATNMMNLATMMLKPDNEKPLNYKILDVFMNNQSLYKAISQAFLLIIEQTKRELTRNITKQELERHDSLHELYPDGPKGTILEEAYPLIMSREQCTKENILKIYQVSEEVAEVIEALLNLSHDLTDAAVLNAQGKASRKRAREEDGQEPEEPVQSTQAA